MAYPTITYSASSNATSGSDTSPYDQSGSGIGAWSGTVLTLSSTVDFTSGSYPVSADGSDYVWVSGVAGERHLAQIAASGFNPSTSACTSITTVESADSAVYATSWHVNGTRLTGAGADSTNMDPEDAVGGWIFEYMGGTYDFTQPIAIGQNTSTAATTPTAIFRAASAATSRPVWNRKTTNGYLVSVQDIPVVFRGLKFTTEVTTGIFRCNNESLSCWDCVFDWNGQGGRIDAYPNANPMILIGCYFTGSTAKAFEITQSCAIVLYGCTIDGQGGTYFSPGVDISGGGRLFMDNCIVMDCLGDGVYCDTTALNGMVSIKNCLIIDNTSDGVYWDSTGAANESNLMLLNNIIAYNGGYGLFASEGGTDVTNRICDYNAVYGNTSDNYSGDFVAGPNAITLTGTDDGSEFNNYAANDFTLADNTRGNQLKGAAYPANMPDGR